MTAWKGAALLLAVLLLLAAGAGLGAWLAAGHYRPQLDTAQKQIADSSAAVASCVTSRESLAAGVDAQNQALVRLQADAAQSAERAQAAQLAAEGRALTAEQNAQAILAERIPAGAEACSAARQAFDHELAKERAR
ncbi:hypothetical protein [Pseudomonas nitroreducens]|uniref:Uncharacterized protein n=1 Tax=Pseudomonas nitroreducens TaxID=46680 RepID=A0A6G6IP47_PSENT|nr:hypothetical protein [Pseudomonas nitroreducens]QIE84733.1 hypothetical protein G5B91_17820 [Pseudomonas nitroreducens]